MTPEDLEEIRERAEKARKSPYVPYVAHAREDVPRLLEYLEELRADRDAWKATAEALEDFDINDFEDAPRPVAPQGVNE